MKEYLVLYYDGNDHHLERRTSASPSSTDPEDFALPPTCDILLVLVGANPLASYLYGKKIEPHNL